MKRVEAEKLLGGYAAGILSDEEKAILFNAALERQEIFDALMDEDVLRQILADPESREKVIAALDFPSTAHSAKIRPFWRKPLWMGLAASAFLVFMTSYAIRRSGVPLPPARLIDTAGAEQGPMKSAGGPEMPPSEHGASDNESEKQAGAAKNAALAELSDSKQSPGDVSAATAPVKNAPHAGAAARERATLSVTSREAAKIALPVSEPERPPIAPLALSADRSQVAGAQMNMEVSRRGRDAAGSAIPNPIWTVTQLDNDRLSIKVVRTLLNAEIVLLLRSDTGVRVVAPIQQSSNDFHYEINIVNGDRIDLYQLRTVAPDYLKLPEFEPITDGRRVRIYPRYNNQST